MIEYRNKSLKHRVTTWLENINVRDFKDVREVMVNGRRKGILREK